mmetsp:Transcript_37007/g.38371  ORF Transcript_37007/g.38371 Transcript_37007/m.38371 type:complete len:377 (-) Transcript_37007:78-1208(-)
MYSLSKSISNKKAVNATHKILGIKLLSYSNRYFHSLYSNRKLCKNTNILTGPAIIQTSLSINRSKNNNILFRMEKKEFSSSKDQESDKPQESEIKSHWDYTKHSLLNHLYMFKFNSDNIGYILHDPKTKSLIGIDFGEFAVSSKVVERLEKQLGAEFRHLFTTHSHWDHSGGNENWKLKKEGKLTIYIGENEDKANNDYIKVYDKRMKDLETLTIGDLCFACMYTPGHLKTHVSYVVTHVAENSTKIPFLFCGDTLFCGSVGKVFNGTYEELYDSISKIMNLPNDTLLFCGHEYTVNNLKFNLKVDPNNDFIKDKLDWAIQTVESGNFTVGSRLVEEKLYNAFVRAGDRYFLELTGEKDPVKSFTKIRLLKDQIKF